MHNRQGHVQRSHRVRDVGHAVWDSRAPLRSSGIAESEAPARARARRASSSGRAPPAIRRSRILANGVQWMFGMPASVG
jgi:hypothetical protein